MAKIKSGLVGVVHVHTKSGVKVLRAGDTVPQGAKVGDHLVEATQTRRTKKQEVVDDAGAGNATSGDDGK